MVTMVHPNESTRRGSDTPPTQYVTVPGGTIAYDVSGSGPVVICAPSIGDVRAEYRFLRPQLVEAGFQVVTTDLRGHGESSTGFDDYTTEAIATDIVALARHLKAGQVTVVGCSKAGGAAVYAAAEAPELIARVVLISPFVRSHGNDAMLRRMMKVLLARPWGVALWAMYFPKFYPSRKPADFDAYRSQLKANLREPGRLQALQAMIDTSSDVSVGLSKVSVPALVVMGSRDPDFKNPTEEGAWIANAVSGTSVSIEGAGHYPHAEMPEKAGPAIIEFLSDASVNHAS